GGDRGCPEHQQGDGEVERAQGSRCAPRITNRGDVDRMTQDPLASALRETCTTLTAHMQVPAHSLDALLDKVPATSSRRTRRLRRALPVGAALLSAAAVGATVLLAMQLGDRTHRDPALPGTGVAASAPYPTS